MSNDEPVGGGYYKSDRPVMFQVAIAVRPSEWRAGSQHVQQTISSASTRFPYPSSASLERLGSRQEFHVFRKMAFRTIPATTDVKAFPIHDFVKKEGAAFAAAAGAIQARP
ncbi:hypothetical protein [Luteibacter sp.]|uniref:hypothetical protein n=1 Tax=Luteibacter sp. TaxID=1886636 RepID=UPI0025BBC529|nr:hypothetical protein [Luteibacter sp.]